MHKPKQINETDAAVDAASLPSRSVRGTSLTFCRAGNAKMLSIVRIPRDASTLFSSKPYDDMHLPTLRHGIE
jgi:hypothetical protein